MLVLVVEDDPAVRASLERSLEFEGYTVVSATDGEAGLAAVATHRPDLVLLDLGLPKVDGLEVCRRLRAAGDGVPVLMLTARESTGDRVRGLDAGADDYLPKPFGPEELLARVHAVLRRARQAPPPPEVVAAGAVRLLPAAREARCAGEVVALTTVEFDLLEILVRAAGRVVTRDELTVALYQRRASPFDRAVDVHVSHLRKKLGRHGDLIRTVHGAGYLFRSGPEAGGAP